MVESGRKSKMFFGSYFHLLDDKNRLYLPSKLRIQCGAKLFVLKGYDGCLSIYTEETFKKFINELSSLSFSDHLSRDVSRIALSSVSELEFDKANRIQIPTALIERYKISKDVVVLGVIDHIEIWSKDKWENYLKENEKDFENKSELLLKKNDKQ